MTPVLQATPPSERVRIVTPFGIRFWDPALEAQVGDHLEVVAYPGHRTDQATRARPTASGIYAFHGLPGLAAQERPDQTTPSPTAQRRFVVRVHDPRGRFLPLAFEEDLPLSGVYPSNLPCASPSLRPPGFYLFSAPGREVSSSLAVVRAQLETRDGLQAAPAAFAVLEIEIPGEATHFGLADQRGCVLAPFPYPSFAAGPGAQASPPPPGPLRWPLVVRVRHLPSTLRFPQGGATPDLRSVLCQPAASFGGGSPASPPGLELDAELVFGETLVLKDPGRSTLGVEPVGGSP